MAETNGSPPPQMTMPQIGVLAQYVKDLSFENPHAPRSLAPSAQQPAINIQINVDAAPMSETDVEVSLRLEGKAESQGMLLFGFKPVASRHSPRAYRMARPIASSRWLLIEPCPRLLFLFAWEIIATITRNGGFPPLLMEPIDFVALYRQRMAAAQQQAVLSPYQMPLNPSLT